MEVLSLKPCFCFSIQLYRNIGIHYLLTRLHLRVWPIIESADKNEIINGNNLNWENSSIYGIDLIILYQLWNGEAFIVGHTQFQKSRIPQIYCQFDCGVLFSPLSKMADFIAISSQQCKCNQHNQFNGWFDNSIYNSAQELRQLGNEDYLIILWRRGASFEGATKMHQIL